MMRHEMMDRGRLVKVLAAHYHMSVEEDSIQPLGEGHIHQTYQVFSKPHRYVFQVFNKQVFRFPERISHNHRLILDSIQGEPLPFTLPLPIPTISGLLFGQDQESIFRMSPFVQGSCVNAINSPRQAFLAADAFAKFISGTKGLNPKDFQESIPGFHDLGLRFRQLKDAMMLTRRQYDQELQSVVDFYLSQESLVRAYEHWKQVLPLRVTHNDTKINNLIFSEDMTAVRAVIDLDTIMAGYAMYDFGDLVRTVACTESESSRDWSKIAVDWKKYEAIREGFLSGGKGLLTEQEIASLAFGGKMMTCIMGFRFLADYLNGNIYYTTQYERQNLDRAINQMWLLNGLGES